MQTVEYGPAVFCDVTGDREGTHRPAGSGAWFCLACGSTTHPTEEAP